MAERHLDPATLMSFAAGSLPEAFAAVAAAHVAMCPLCRREARRMESLGAAMFAGLDVVPLERPAPVAGLRRGEADALVLPPREAARGEVPAPLARVIGSSLDDVAWRRVGLGVWTHRVPLSANARGDLRLLRVLPGYRIPDHGHGGSELTLVLRGAYHDEIGEFRVGDVADLDDEVEHRPVADDETGCVCIIASERLPRPTGVLGRLLRPITG